ncbi:MAG: stage II sporulation protein E [Tissierellia bacterium]|nr:stage II sporulation protein E [Tissierellia bacterium]
MFKAELILPKNKRFNKILDLDSSYFLNIILAFFIGRANIMDKLTPFGIGFIAAYLITGKFNLFLFLSTILGMMTFQGLAGLEYLLAISLIFIIYNKYEKKAKTTLIKSSLIIGIIFTLTRLSIILLFKNIFIYDIFIIIFEGITVFTLSYIFSYGLSTESVNKAYSNEKIICFFILLSLIISGIGDLSILGMSIKNIINAVIILYFAYSEGAFIGGAIGISLGLTNYISQTEMPFMLAIYALGGLLSGLFRELGKTGSILGFLIGTSIVSFYINGYIISFINLRELILSIILFYTIYRPLNSYISGHVDILVGRNKEENYFQRKEELIVNRLNQVSNVFKDLGKGFKNSTEMDFTIDPKEAYSLVDKVANSICAKCGMRRFCWEEGFYTTYYAIFNMVSVLEEKKPLVENNIPISIRDYCINKEKLIGEINRNFATFQINASWKKKILENRILVSDQLKEVANIIDNMTKDIYKNPIFKEDIEEVIFANLKNNRIDVEAVTVIELEDEDFEIYVDIDKAYKKINEGENIRKIVSNSINTTLKLCMVYGRGQAEKMKYKLIKSNRYNALTRVISKANSINNISGDNYTFGEEENGYFVALSDGMGIGSKANAESSIAINLLESFLEANFDKALALRTINSILRLKSNEEIFATLDISLMDLCTGKLQIIKSGSSATFIKKKDKVKVINPNSLPVGILEDVDFNTYEEYLEDGDIVIMMSDGVLEANENALNKEKWIKNIIEDIDSVNPTTIAQSILNKVAEQPNSGKDDMTILVTKIWKTV